MSDPVDDKQPAAGGVVLVVEDDEAIKGVVTRSLAHHGYTVIEARSAPDAFDTLDSATVDVLVVDIHLSGPLTGLDLLRQLPVRAPHARAIIVTAFASKDTAIEALRLGAFDYLEKPFRVPDLVAKVGAALEDLRAELDRGALAEKHNALFETIAGIVWFATDGGRFKRINRSGAALLGYQPEQLLEQAHEVLLPSETTDPAVHWAFKERRTGSRATRGQRVEVRTASGATKLFDVYSSGVRVPGLAPNIAASRSLGTVGFAVDVTEQVRERAAAEAERVRLELELRQSELAAATGRVVRGVAHEINNPLAYIGANLRFLQEQLADLAARSPGAPVAELVDVVRETAGGADRIRDLVADLALFSRSDPEPRAAVHIGDVLEPALKIAANEIRHRARVIREIDDVPPVQGSASRLGQVFLHVIMNAAEAIPPGHADQNVIRVRTSSAPSGDVVVEVIDTGEGMPPEVCARVFEPFFTTKPQGYGTGLGLSLCHAIVTSHGGTIVVDSAVGRGTTVRVTLPRATATPASIVAPVPALPAAGARRGRILIVDDEEVIGTALRRLLASEHDVIATTAGAQALELLRQGERFDVILCDLMMPNMNGLELGAELELSYPDQAKGLVFITGGTLAAPIAADEPLGCVPRVAKPFDIPALRTLIRSLVG
ncbi:MAG: hypothetical protein A2138_13270 [Deltaproteobacteria bacterium RBG_16_71_12]|nr:MAG: hypothetical protein A2138_13270 [Deltaproteobacteria bacterium RBG_16_71_12]